MAKNYYFKKNVAVSTRKKGGASSGSEGGIPP